MHTSRVWRFVKTSLTYSMTRSIVLQLVRMYGAKLAASSQVGSKLQRSFPAWGRGESGGALSSTPLHMHSATYAGATPSCFNYIPVSASQAWLGDTRVLVATV